MSFSHAAEVSRKPARSAPADLLASRLRAASAAHHVAVEALPALTRLFDAQLTPAAYAATLRGLLHAQGACERALRTHADAWDGRGLDWSVRLCKSEWLVHDLSALGQPAAACDASVGGVPALTDLPRCAGSMYVLEGATLGGRVILKALRRNASLPVDAQHYFNGYGASTANRWTTFWRQLESAQAWDEQAMSAAASAACDTFSLFHRCLIEVDG